MSLLLTKQITVIGMVQGVNYRWNTKEIATELGITGIVKNKPDGSVEMLVTGTHEQLNKLIEWAWKGSARAIVRAVQEKDVPLRVFPDFSIVR